MGRNADEWNRKGRCPIRLGRDHDDDDGDGKECVLSGPSTDQRPPVLWLGARLWSWWYWYRHFHVRHRNGSDKVCRVPWDWLGHTL